MINSSDDVSFTVAADPSGSVTPNILSDVRWDDMETWILEGDLRLGLTDRLRLVADFGLGAIRDGRAMDRDFDGDNRTDEFSRSTARVDGKHHTHLNVGLGYEFSKSFELPLWRIGESSRRVALASDISFSPEIGYSYIKKEISFTDGIQLIPDEGPFQGLNSSYDPTWSGSYIGFDSQFRIFRGLFISAAARYWIDVTAEADARWNLRSDLQQLPSSFSQSADASGTMFQSGFSWVFRNGNSISVSYRHSKFESDAGVDETTTAQGERFATRLNELEWRNHGWMIGFEWAF